MRCLRVLNEHKATKNPAVARRVHKAEALNPRLHLGDFNSRSGLGCVVEGDLHLGAGNETFNNNAFSEDESGIVFEGDGLGGFVESLHNAFNFTGECGGSESNGCDERGEDLLHGVTPYSSCFARSRNRLGRR